MWPVERGPKYKWRTNENTGSRPVRHILRVPTARGWVEDANQVRLDCFADESGCASGVIKTEACADTGVGNPLAANVVEHVCR
jgi:hypothetical protein